LGAASASVSTARARSGTSCAVKRWQSPSAPWSGWCAPRAWRVGRRAKGTPLAGWSAS